MEYGQVPEIAYSRLGQYNVLRAERSPCPICGHPTGDCAGESPPPTHIWGVGSIPSMEDQQMILVEEDVYEYRQITPFTKSKVLLAAKGKQISVTKARELGIM